MSKDDVSISELDKRSVIHMEMIGEHDKRIEKLERLVLSIKELIDKSCIENIYGEGDE